MPMYRHVITIYIYIYIYISIFINIAELRDCMKFNINNIFYKSNEEYMY